jgi:hypothetical protein
LYTRAHTRINHGLTSPPPPNPNTQPLNPRDISTLTPFHRKVHAILLYEQAREEDAQRIKVELAEVVLADVTQRGYDDEIIEQRRALGTIAVYCAHRD